MRDIRNSGKVIGVERIAVMAALNITHEMLTGSHQQDSTLSAQQAQISELVKRLDQALESHKA
jgi:cell division protein ZapA